MSKFSSAHSPRPLCLSIALAFAAADAGAMSLTVNDASDAAAPTGCTLRGAISAVNNAAFAASDPCTTAGTFGSSDTIDFAAALAGSTITLQQGQLAFSKPVVITGSGQTIDAGGASAVLNVASNVSASNLVLTNGHSIGKGGAAYVKGSAAYLALTHVTVSASSAVTGGGGIYVGNLATLILNDSTVTSNTSAGEGGGGLYVAGAYARITDSTISGNTGACTANYCAGAIYVTSDANGGSNVSIIGSTVSDNITTGIKNYVVGGIYSYASAVSIANSTITGNSGVGNDLVAGALLENHGTTAPTSYGFTLANTTVSGNTATTASGTASHIVGGALIGVYNTGRLTLGNTIIAANSASGNAAPNNDLDTISANAPTLNFSYSLLGAALNVAPYNSAANHNAFSDAPGLGPLQNHGGKTRTMALLNGSLAIDAGSNTLAVDPSSAALQTDQTGFVRIYNTTVDIGAFEFPGDHIFGDGFELIAN